MYTHIYVTRFLSHSASFCLSLSSLSYVYTHTTTTPSAINNHPSTHPPTHNTHTHMNRLRDINNGLRPFNALEPTAPEVT